MFGTLLLFRAAIPKHFEMENTKHITNTNLLTPFQGFVTFAICRHRAMPYAIAMTLAGSDSPNEFILKRGLKQLISPEGININSPQPAPTSRGIYPGVVIRTTKAAHENRFLKFLLCHAPQHPII
jgi:hypothetical protein